MTDNNPLFDEPKLDEFKTESPLRAFASFDMFGNYLIAKGFRPSLGHLTRYLDAMEKKEGWQFVQLLEAGTGVPTIIFRKVSVPIPALIDPDKEKMVNAILRRQGIIVDTPDGEVTGVEHAKFDGHPLEAPFGEGILTIKGLDPEKVIWNRVQWRGEIEKLFDAARGRPHHIKVKDFLRRENVTDMRHYYRTASVASVLRLIDMFEGWDTYALDEYISDDALYTAIGRVNVKARAACKTDVYTAFANAIRESEVTSDDEELATYQPPINPVDVLEKAAEDIADDLGLEVDRESFAVAREHLEEMVPLDAEGRPWNSRGSDIDIPSEFREECARFVLTKMVGPEYLEQSIRDFKKSFLNPKGKPISHTTMAQQLIFHLGSRHPHVVKRHIDQFRTTMGKTVEHVVYKAGERTVHEVNIESKFDDANPEHYNGWACGDIGERLSANGYQILKYCWRLGKKDDPCKELGKALRYLERERDLMSQKGHPNHRSANWCGLISPDNFFNKRVADQSIFTTRVAFFLWHGYNVGDLDKLQAIIADHKAHLDCGHGLAI